MSTEIIPSTNGANGRTKTGRFAKGCKGGPGNPFVKAQCQLRARIMQVVTEDDIGDVIEKLLQMAKDGDIAAIKELLDRTIGKPVSVMEVTAKNGPMLDPAKLTDEDIGALERIYSRLSS